MRLQRKILSFLKLLEHEDQAVVELVEARLGNKSSQAVTRVNIAWICQTVDYSYSIRVLRSPILVQIASTELTSESTATSSSRQVYTCWN